MNCLCLQLSNGLIASNREKVVYDTPWYQLHPFFTWDTYFLFWIAVFFIRYVTYIYNIVFQNLFLIFIVKLSVHPSALFYLLHLLTIWHYFDDGNWWRFVSIHLSGAWIVNVFFYFGKWVLMVERWCGMCIPLNIPDLA